MMKPIALAAILLSLAPVAGACSPQEQGEETDSTSDALQSVPYCETSDHTFGLNVGLVQGIKMEDGPIKFKFTRDGTGRSKNDAIVRLRHQDKSWVEFRTTDDISDNIEKRPFLLVRGMSDVDKGTSPRLVNGDVLEITANFDVRGGADRHCKATLRFGDFSPDVGAGPATGKGP